MIGSTCDCGYKNDRNGHSAYSMISLSHQPKLFNNKKLTSHKNKLNKNNLDDSLHVGQEFGRNSIHLVKNLTSVSNIEKTFSIINHKLCSQSYIQATKHIFV